MHVLIPWDGARVRVRNGALTEVVVPWSAVVSARTVDPGLPSSIWTLQPEETPTGTHQRVGVSGRANVTIDLRRPLLVRPTRNRELTVTRVSFCTDDPRAVVRTVQERAAAHADT